MTTLAKETRTRLRVTWLQLVALGALSIGASAQAAPSSPAIVAAQGEPSALQKVRFYDYGSRDGMVAQLGDTAAGVMALALGDIVPGHTAMAITAHGVQVPSPFSGKSKSPKSFAASASRRGLILS
jgi:hypothetical protein